MTHQSILDAYKSVYVEAVLVGIYSMIIFIPFTNLPLQISLIFHAVLKHMTGYIFGIQDYYCVAKCNKERAYAPVSYFGEIALFLLFGNIIFRIFPKRVFLSAFLTGATIHMFCEYAGIHAQFCRSGCTNAPITPAEVILKYY